MELLSTLEPLRKTSTDPFRARIPGSKSYTNRALVLAAQRMGQTAVEGGLHCDDTFRLAEALDSFEGLSVAKTDTGFRAERTRERLGAPATECFMGGAGTPARFMLGFSAAAEGGTVVTGIPRLCERPMKDILDALRGAGIRYESVGETDHLPIRVHGGQVTTRDWSIHAGISSQFTSSLCLLAAQQDPAGGPVTIRLTGTQVSRPYVQMTLSMMNACGIRAAREGDDRIVVHPGTPQHETIPVEVDASGMSYYLAAAAVTGTTVEIPGIGKGSAQGDVGLARAFGDMGCEVELTDDVIRLKGGALRGIDIDMDKMPDVVLTLAAVAAVAEGETRITNIANLRVKECDRIAAAASELGRMGVDVEEGPDFLVIRPDGSRGASLKPARIETYDDHRVAMSMAVLSLIAPGIEIEDPGCVAKSFPEFWNELERFRAHHEG